MSAHSCILSSLAIFEITSQHSSSTAHMIVGAYDIGHPAVLIANDLSDWNTLVDLAQTAQHVGLEVQQVLALVTHRIPASSRILPVSGIASLEDLTKAIAASGDLAPHHAQAVLTWLEQVL